MRPEIIVADEPSSGLDPRARRELIRLIDSLPQTMLVATHDVDLARAVLPRCVIMNNGRVVADGPTEELTGDQEFLESCGLVEGRGATGSRFCASVFGRLSAREIDLVPIENLD